MHDDNSIFSSLPASAQQWLEGLSWEQRRYVLSLCHIICAMSPEAQAAFLDEYTADGLITRILEDTDTQQRVNAHLRKFHLDITLTENVLRHYIRQFYVHSAQDARQQPDLYLKSALKLVSKGEQLSNVFSYVLGFELIALIFNMSWAQHERLYRLQRHQDEFLRTYIRPVQYAHGLNGIIIPKDEGRFFARRDYYVQKPNLSGKRLETLVIATFKTSTLCNLGGSIIRHPKSFQFDYDYIFNDDEDYGLFTEDQGNLCI